MKWDNVRLLKMDLRNTFYTVLDLLWKHKRDYIMGTEKKQQYRIFYSIFIYIHENLVPAFFCSSVPILFYKRFRFASIGKEGRAGSNAMVYQGVCVFFIVVLVTVLAAIPAE